MATTDDIITKAHRKAAKKAIDTALADTMRREIHDMVQIEVRRFLRLHKPQLTKAVRAAFKRALTKELPRLASEAVKRANIFIND